MENTVLSTKIKFCNTKLEAVFQPDGFKFDHSSRLEKEEDSLLFEESVSNPYLFLYDLSFQEMKPGDPSLRYLFEITDRFVEKLLHQPELETAGPQTQAVFDEDELDEMIACVPFVYNAEQISRGWLLSFFSKMQDVFFQEASAFDGTIRQYFASKNPDLHLPDRLCFQLVENKNDDTYPFAFMVTYTRKDPDGKIRHVPLIESLQEFKEDRARILNLLKGLNDAARLCPLVEELMVSGELMHPVRLTSKEAWQFLSSISSLMELGMICRVPNWWKKKYSSVSSSVSLGAKKQSLFGLQTLIEMRPYLKVNGRTLTKAEISQLLAADEGLLMIKGDWVEVNHARLQELLEAMDKNTGDLTLAQILQAEAGIGTSTVLDSKTVLSNGAWLSSLLKTMQNPKMAAASSIPKTVQAKLRPYQRSGVGWLRTMGSYGFGACLADDMGLGKTLQVLTYLEGLRKEEEDLHILLVVPASLLGNWKAEAEKFVPSMPVKIFHGKSSASLEEELQQQLSFLNITTYGMALRLQGLREKEWDCLILDEAQAIKNPNTKQTQAVKLIPAKQKIALTGTPIENNLLNLWSIFDFLNQGLLGSSTEFKSYAKGLEENPAGYGGLRKIIQPFLLRRLKTDKKIVSDLPDKIEQVDFIELSARQKVLYHREIEQLEKKLEQMAEQGIDRKGLVLASITHLKQICNHPDQFVSGDEFKPSDSGKYEFLKEILEPIQESRECVLVFSQYKTMTDRLDTYLENLFGRKGLVINGDTPIKLRQEYADQFNAQKTWIPYMVLSIKAAGTGLNLTAANHVIHFDRWWNPAVENQATDRAFRIGQKKNVLVHKFVCKGTMEEKIQQLIEDKQAMADSIVGSSQEGAEKLLVNMSNEELISMLKLED